MAEKRKGLGRGLDEMFLDNSIETKDNVSAVSLKINDIEPNKKQARKEFKEEALTELAESIAKHGILQPLLVRPIINSSTYELIAGERRWRAARIAGLKEVPVIIKQLTDEEAAVISLIENLQREDLNPVEEAKGLSDLIEVYGITQEEAADKVGKSRPAIANSLRLLKLPKKVLEMLSSGLLTTGHAKALLSLDNKDKIISLAHTVTEKGLSVRETEKLVKELNKTKIEKKVSTTRNTYFDEVELALNNALGRKARVITKGKKENGILELAFYSKEDLETIVKALETLEN